MLVIESKQHAQRRHFMNNCTMIDNDEKNYKTKLKDFVNDPVIKLFSNHLKSSFRAKIVNVVNWKQDILVCFELTHVFQTYCFSHTTRRHYFQQLRDLKLAFFH